MSPIVINTTNTGKVVDKTHDTIEGRVTTEPQSKRFTSEDIATKEKGTYDLGILDYHFDGNNEYANNHSGVEIDGFLFFPDEVGGDESFTRRDFKRTDIMSGGQFISRGQYIPRKFSFNTTLEIDPDNPNMYDKVFQIMENKLCEIISPYMGEMFKGTVKIDKTHPKASPRDLKLSIGVEEAPDPKATVVGDTTIVYPSTTRLDDHAISVKTIDNPNKKTPEELEQEQITYNLEATDTDGKVFVNPYADDEEGG